MNANVELISDGRPRLRPPLQPVLFFFKPFFLLSMTAFSLIWILFIMKTLLIYQFQKLRLKDFIASRLLETLSMLWRILKKTGLQWHHLYIRVCIYLWFFVKVGVQMMREIYHLIRGSQMTWGFTEQKAFQASNPQAFRKWLTLTKRNCRITAPFFARALRCCCTILGSSWGHDQLDSSLTFSPLGLWILGKISAAIGGPNMLVYHVWCAVWCHFRKAENLSDLKWFEASHFTRDKHNILRFYSKNSISTAYLVCK